MTLELLATSFLFHSSYWFARELHNESLDSTGVFLGSVMKGRRNQREETDMKSKKSVKEERVLTNGETTEAGKETRKDN